MNDRWQGIESAPDSTEMCLQEVTCYVDLRTYLYVNSQPGAAFTNMD